MIIEGYRRKPVTIYNEMSLCHRFILNAPNCVMGNQNIV